MNARARSNPHRTTLVLFELGWGCCSLPPIRSRPLRRIPGIRKCEGDSILMRKISLVLDCRHEGNASEDQCIAVFGIPKNPYCYLKQLT